MYKILFVCHGNICRSPMAEFVFKDMVRREGLEEQFMIASAATSREEIGNGVHRGTRRLLEAHGISPAGKRAVQMTAWDYESYDYLIGMDQRNLVNMERIAGGDRDGKIFGLLSFAGLSRDISDPWYTGNFDQTWEDVNLGCEALLRHIREQDGIG